MKIRVMLMAALVMALAGPALAGDDPSIPKAEKKKIQASIEKHIKGLSQHGLYPIFDPESRLLVGMKYETLHKAVGKKGNYFVSCADFTGIDGIKYDVDLLVGKKGKSYQVVESLIHKRDGKKSPYDVQH